MNVVRYHAQQKTAWNAFIAASKNGTFLLHRDYMEYHNDRFEDHSLCFVDNKGHLRAVLPATCHKVSLVSHGGLTYGGVICGEDMTTPLMLDVFTALISYAKTAGFSRILYKTVPQIYARLPAEEDRYALFLNNSNLVRRDVLSVIAQQNQGPVQARRERKIRQAESAHLRIVDSQEFGSFWPVLERNLLERHQVRPVHTLPEIELLATRFPENIKAHWVVDSDGQILAGVVMYVSDRVAHAQYISTSAVGREIGALDFLFSVLIADRYADKAYFDFGISNEDDGRTLNLGLIEQKEGFGARAVVHDYYELLLV